VEDLCAGQITSVVADLALITSHRQHLSVRKQRARLSLSLRVQSRRVAESSTPGIVQLRTRDRAEMAAGNDQNLPAGERVCPVKEARRVQPSRNCEPPRRNRVARCKLHTIDAKIARVGCAMSNKLVMIL